MMTLRSGQMIVHIHPDETSMGAAAAESAIQSGLNAKAEGKRVVFWLMAAPSGFTFYDAFVGRVRSDSAAAELVRNARFYQFDDYPIPRGSERFPVTFRHLLETRLFDPIRTAAGGIGSVNPLELTGDGTKDSEVVQRYTEFLADELSATESVVIEVKGIGMDGHWGFHGAETPLEDPPGLMRVPVSSANIRQQMIDWPDYFPSVDSVPKYAVTANVGLFMQADHIIDVVPQAEKEYAILACYGNDQTHPAVPSSAAKEHPAAESHIASPAARALFEVRGIDGQAQARNRLPRESVERLKRLWHTPEDVDAMLRVLRDLQLA